VLASCQYKLHQYGITHVIAVRQVKAARALLGWSQSDLARYSGVSGPTIGRLESANEELGGREKTGEKIMAALISAGVEFIEENGGGPGVRLLNSIPKKPGGVLTRTELVQGTNEAQQQRHPGNVDTVTMKAIQLRMARAAIGWGVRELAKKAGITANTVTRIENGADAKQSTMDALQRALEAAGVEFTNGEQPGVRLTKAAAARPAESAGASNPRAAAKTARHKTAKTTEKKR
jgi:transcriptional regulator with XRE-family HTH domain